MGGAEIGDCLLAGRQRMVVNYAVAALRQLRIEPFERLNGRTVHVAIKPDDREGLIVQLVQRVLEETFDENDLLVEQSISTEMIFDLAARDGELGESMQFVSLSAGYLPGSGGGNPANESATYTFLA